MLQTLQQVKTSIYVYQSLIATSHYNDNPYKDIAHLTHLLIILLIINPVIEQFIPIVQYHNWTMFL